MKFLLILTQPSIYHICSTQKTFCEENFTGKEDLFLSVNMKNCGRCKIRKGFSNRSGFQDQSKVAKIQKGKVCHRNVSEKDLSKIIKEF